MKKVFFALLAIMQIGFSSAQTVSELQQTARTFMRQGDYSNALLVLNKALKQEPENFALLKDIALNHFFNKEPQKAIEIVKPLLDRDDADDQVFQIAGNIYKASKEFKEGEKVYRKGIKRFPNSGPLYNDFGEMLWVSNDKEALFIFEKGIQVDPSYANNYLNAAYYLSTTPDRIWQLIYAEMYLNMQPSGSQVPPLKEMLLRGYKKLYADGDFDTYIKEEKSDFGKEVLKTLAKQSQVSGMGITAETLTMIRTRFILDWYNEPVAAKFPFKLFETQRNLLQEGMYDAYNQWLFGPAQNLQEFQSWASSHATEYNSFVTLQKNRLFKVPLSQYYK